MATVTTTPQPQMIPGPHALPLLGWRMNLLKVYLKPFTYLPWLHRTYGNIVALAQDHPHHICVFGPEMNFRVLANPDLFGTSAAPLVKLPKDTALGRLFYHGLPLQNGERHRQHRRLMQPAFHKKQIAQYHADMALLTQQMLDQWQARATAGATLDVLTEIKQLTQRIAVKTLFGMDDQAEIERIGGLLQALKIAPLALALPLNVPGSPYHRVLRLAKQMEAFTHALITKKRLQPEATDVLSVLVHTHDEDGAQLSDDELMSNIFTLFVAGHETTSHTLTWTLFLLDQHPRICSDLLDELEGTAHGSVPTPEQLMRLSLLDNVIKESLRLLPPASIGVRVTTTACDLGGYPLPAAASVLYSEYVTHRLPELYEHPSCFMPARWGTINRTPYEYLPFSAGHHRCIGAEFATYEMKIVLAMLLQRYRLSLIPNTKVSTNIGMRPSPGIPMQIFPQDRQFRQPPTVRGTIHRLVDIQRSW
ncbi:cytochrome P450 [Ktedonospora formicarum]|uniref:Cytochrome P450 n=1 Tax=Ktedonospora formicarum TaxID=2778364 RepID=A0A8J3IB20_9CHLR|nr:cytochrome P450 [Ktedonospora formicarum]GHO48784.1 cytochrome P450 [Ktedonospora formicarum]